MSPESIVRILLASAGLIYMILGSAHLFFTFFSNRFQSRDPAVAEAMKRTSPILTGRTTMWKAWVGFNASHSTGAIFFGFILTFAALANLRLYANSEIIQGVTLANSLFYLWLGIRYWFRIPLTGIVLSTLLQLTALVVIYLNGLNH